MSRAAVMIENALRPMITRGRDINRIVLYVSPESKLTEVGVIETDFGDLRVKVHNHLPQGKAYVMEDPSIIGRGFAWVAR